MAKTTIQIGREQIAQRAEADGEMTFAREVRAGSWDHRSDVAAAIAVAQARAEMALELTETIARLSTTDEQGDDVGNDDALDTLDGLIAKARGI